MPFPSLFESPSLDLSIVIPAYNEEERLPVMLEESVSYLVQNFSDKFEIILVDDGSKDKTTAVALVRQFRSESHILKRNYFHFKVVLIGSVILEYRQCRNTFVLSRSVYCKYFLILILEALAT